MIRYQTKIEFKRACTKTQVLIWLFLVFTLPAIKFYMVREGYAYYRQLDLFARVNSDFVPLLFALIVVVAYAPMFIREQKNNFLNYVSLRISLTDYFKAKLIVNAFITFVLSFLIVFLPFLFVMYIEPSIGIVTIMTNEHGNPIPYTTFEQFLSLGSLLYGLIYSIWVGINGALYSTIGLLMLMIIEKPLYSLAAPVMLYLIGNFVTAIFGQFQFSPIYTIFPFSIAQQPLWTIFVPFSIILSVTIFLIFKLRIRLASSYE